MGEAFNDALRLDFERKLKVEFHGTKVTSDGGPDSDIIDCVACRNTDYGVK